MARPAGLCCRYCSGLCSPPLSRICPKLWQELASVFGSFARQIAEHLGYLWAAMLDRAGALPLGHDG